MTNDLCPVQHFTGDLNAYAAHIHELNMKWWTNADGTPKELDKGERFMLMVSELAEAMEGDRKDLQDDHLPQYKMIHVELADCVIRVMDSGHVYGWDFSIRANDAVLDWSPFTVGRKLLNIVEHLICLASEEIQEGGVYGSDYPRGIIDQCEALANELGASDFWQIVYDKLVYNWSRLDHQHASRNAPGGKRY